MMQGETTNSAQPLSATSGLRSTTGSSSSLGGTLSGNAGTRPGQVSIDSTSSDAGALLSLPCSPVPQPCMPMTGSPSPLGLPSCAYGALN